MSDKTPEQKQDCVASQMAVDWYIRLLTEEPAVAIKEAYQVGYQAGRSNSEGVQAAKDQLADADKVMCNTTMEEIKAIDTGEIIPITNLPTPAKWISVKERLPDEGEEVLIFGQYLNDIPKVLGVRSRYKGDQDWKYTWEGPDEWVYRENDVTHWMPLPEAPKGEK